MSTGFKKCGKVVGDNPPCEEKCEPGQAHCRGHLFSLSPKESYPEETTVPCKFCGDPTEKTATKMCDVCWELRVRLRMVDYDVLMEIIRDLDKADLNVIVKGS